MRVPKLELVTPVRLIQACIRDTISLLKRRLPHLTFGASPTTSLLPAADPDLTLRVMWTEVS
jgi:hypothetical protein